MAILESRWTANSNTSVRPVFELLADVFCSGRHPYHYEMFGTLKGFREALLRNAVRRGVRLLYLATHGHAKGLDTAGDEHISRTALANSIEKLSDTWGGSLDGLFIGACDFGTHDNLHFVATPLQLSKIKVRWIAGYDKTVNWATSAAFELLFFDIYLRRRDGKKETEKQRIVATAKELEGLAAGACKKLGFHLLTRKAGLNSGWRDLIGGSDNK